MAFAERNYDVLLATTIIKNGVNIPRVNTMIIQNAQSFGMSTLYQLHGRIGRSDLQAYTYFFQKNDYITEQSAQRLQAMADLQKISSGFDVANCDYEICCAGSTLVVLLDASGGGGGGGGGGNNDAMIGNEACQRRVDDNNPGGGIVATGVVGAPRLQRRLDCGGADLWNA